MLVDVLAEIRRVRPRLRLDIGQPDFPPPQEVVEALRRHASSAEYAPPEGLPELRERIAEWVGVDPGEVVVTVGAKMGLAAVMRLFRAIHVPRPWYMGYVEVADLFGVELRPIDTRLEVGWVPRWPGRGVYLVNYPNNPTGVVLPRDSVKALLDVAEFVISDEPYRELVWGEFTSPFRLRPETVLVHSFSKNLAVPGFRVGFVAGPREVVRRVVEFVRAVANDVPTPQQRALAETLHLVDRYAREMAREYARRAEAMSAALRLRHVKPSGAFYIFAEVPCDDKAFFAKLLSSGVSVLPGSLFGAPGFVRISLTAPVEELVEAAEVINRVADSCAETRRT